ncbi:MAG: isochorismatase family protein [Candidatus Thiodiazotropha sp. (ex Lucinoma aequizonata)]|nr:isochorismatase family protein [Candidatus Thiodiazotropha sp. (ex Lucinoma aequizonata)]MCU7890013.1 isochorismatase family protein [Candidatus Thiodiazotropha sp. (ex Lucinoma aequizonata)]MCU7894044.1 isochorismatase family protein [Candidatus Thiodiazotropha sp. (ex Lucinoma aequizonata)]MCU7899914.1 isochorismatase family protein [Candidatus Thiodiazotropha sp. (ex Lucinoma aequizonata)]MCU7904024.1 isochorismatase family protein [Candidatus Thiodiazotropha sp. (ex Lucinoma aequizonata)
MSISKSTLPLTHANNSQLLIVNTQERLTKAMHKPDMDRMVSSIIQLSQAASVLEVPIILSEHYGKDLGNTLPEIAEHLLPHIKAKDKLTFSCCTAPGFEEELAENGERKQIIIVGLEAHICVLQTASGLQQWGYQVFVVEDAVSSRNPMHRKNSLKRMQQEGVHITNSESVAFEWMGDASHSKFKEVSQLFR